MKYENYKKEDLVFLTKTDWTEEEMKEVLDTFPESRDAEKIREALNKVLEAIENGTLKVNRYGEINKQSAKAYANRHNYVKYGAIRERWYSYDNCFYIEIDGESICINSRYNIKDTLNYFDNIERRFKNVVSRYKKAEERYKNETETKNYEETNRERIIANKIADCYLHEFEIRILKDFENYRYSNDEIPNYRTHIKTLRGGGYINRNDHDELEFYGKVVSKEDAEKIVEIMKEANRKAELIIDRVSIELREIQEKYRDENKGGN